MYQRFRSGLAERLFGLEGGPAFCRLARIFFFGRIRIQRQLNCIGGFHSCFFRCIVRCGRRIRLLGKSDHNMPAFQIDCSVVLEGFGFYENLQPFRKLRHTRIPNEKCLLASETVSPAPPNTFSAAHPANKGVPDRLSLLFLRITDGNLILSFC